MHEPTETTYPFAFRLDNKVAIITGGASGIGLATAKMFVAAGASIVLIDLGKEKVKSAALEVSEDRKNCFGLSGDVSDEPQMKKIFQKITTINDRIDVLVNCAGITIRKPATELPLEDWNSVLNVNITGSFLPARLAAPIMTKNRSGGAIVNIASIMGLSGGGLYPNISYQTAKGAIINMTRAMAVEWASQKIRVNAIAPTYVRTPFIKSILENEEIIKEIEKMTPLGRLAEPEEVAAAILFLASPAATMITGHTLAVDGGYLAQ